VLEVWILSLSGILIFHFGIVLVVWSFLSIISFHDYLYRRLLLLRFHFMIIFIDDCCY
jgi:hypothetical protein